ncbi:MAG: MFS transporter [Mycobacterium sp.]|uniref:MFS transporter n=1 Tax=Mycobacterium sp. TaxID=1785 RepID=UPI002632FD9B|nr:MFS transporter [Mycobacterium sp.]MDI3315827.1 MFS transporter [Mycobacterium sp.]
MVPPDRATSASRARDRAALLAVNFFMADMHAGIGSFLGVLLASRGWGTGAIGTVTAIGGIAGLVAVTPAGTLIDATIRKRTIVIVAGVFTVAASGLILLSRQFWVIAGAQAATAIAGAALGPAVIGITLGVVRQTGFTAQIGRNQAYNHAGNMAGAALSGLLGWRFGFAAVFWLAALFALITITAVLMIPACRIDHQAARGAAGTDHRLRVKGLRALIESPALLALAGAVALFHLGNAAMLPLYGLAVVATHANPFITVSSTVVIAQTVMIVASLSAMRVAESQGYWLAIMIAFTALPIRGLIAAGIITPWGIIPVQILDGIGAGMLSVAVPGLVARLLDGTGHINAGQGAVLTAQGIGAAISPLLGGHLAQEFGYPTTFTVLGALSVGALIIWVKYRSVLQPDNTAYGSGVTSAGGGPGVAHSPVE